VEHETQHRLLRDMGCDEIQGYLHGRPMPQADLAAWLAQRTP
jgi:EAL domain-containing protein (putative c-di-GMP-specific phosphodiesterase class I)